MVFGTHSATWMNLNTQCLILIVKVFDNLKLVHYRQTRECQHQFFHHILEVRAHFKPFATDVVNLRQLTVISGEHFETL